MYIYMGGARKAHPPLFSDSRKNKKKEFTGK